MFLGREFKFTCTQAELKDDADLAIIRLKDNERFMRPLNISSIPENENEKPKVAFFLALLTRRLVKLKKLKKKYWFHWLN